mgnify:CR=1 FL=1
MSTEIQTVLILLALFQVKHTFADYFMQTQRMLSNRSVYAHVGRVQHAGIHAILTLLVVLIVGLPLSVALTLFAIDGVVHFHIDWLKGTYSESSGEGPDQRNYWRAFGVDQLAHQLTYVGMVWFWLAVLAA